MNPLNLKTLFKGRGRTAASVTASAPMMSSATSGLNPCPVGGLGAAALNNGVDDFVTDVLAIGDEQAVVNMEAPISLLIGSVSGCTYKDAMSYVHSLIDSVSVLPDMVHYRIIEDKTSARFAYEIHEGGPGFSVIEAVLDQLATGKEVRIATVNNQHVCIQEVHGEVFTLNFPSPEEALSAGTEVEAAATQRIRPITEFLAKKKLTPFLSAKDYLKPLAVGTVSASGVLLVVALAIWSIKASGLLSGDFIAHQMLGRGQISKISDNPITHFERAKKVAEDQGKTFLKFEKKNGRWTHTLQ